MFPGRSKIKKAGDKPVTEFESKIVKELESLEHSNSSIKALIAPLHITAAKPIDIDGGKQAIVIWVPYNQLSAYRKIQKSLVEELEKKFSGKHVIIVAQRTMFKSTFTRDVKTSGIRPRSRTLKHVQEALLEDVVYPAEIVGKRTLMRTDGSRLMKVHLNPKKEKVNVETRLETFSNVYAKLCNKRVSFEFPVVAKGSSRS
eukprot:CAMPEP_0185572038 /NCGR_PEP_ID=MMETSP0434-20130131/4030_1 /TAXON_ID=626734 ORGANISM="Favella taraikaensis, Strain Fe Narragansett Bay" /NCGR_SAMPLE_ID=MMETSP0434 /ASSEMBLY_ACC=CAM_ASM_000379 /LENGTH=200 /DNA_ID=CAMNT_0028187735 /DNA_START=39 /DNA_END=641 /DNA_ORIENTATION=-